MITVQCIKRKCVLIIIIFIFNHRILWSQPQPIIWKTAKMGPFEPTVAVSPSLGWDLTDVCLKYDYHTYSCGQMFTSHFRIWKTIRGGSFCLSTALMNHFTSFNQRLHELTNVSVMFLERGPFCAWLTRYQWDRAVLPGSARSIMHASH